MTKEMKNKKHRSLREMLSGLSDSRVAKSSVTLFPCFQALLVAAAVVTFNPKDPIPEYDTNSDKNIQTSVENNLSAVDLAFLAAADLKDVYTEYYDNGQIKSEWIKEKGVKYRKVYYEDGQLKFESARDYLDYQSKSYYPDGQTRTIHTQQNDSYTKQSYNKNGKLSFESSKKDGVQQYKSYDSDGNLFYILTETDNMKSSQYFYETGVMRSETIKRDGITKIKEYHKNGQLKHESTVKDGVEIDTSSPNLKEEQKSSTTQPNNTLSYLIAKNKGR